MNTEIKKCMEKKDEEIKRLMQLVIDLECEKTILQDLYNDQSVHIVTQAEVQKQPPVPMQHNLSQLSRVKRIKEKDRKEHRLPDFQLLMWKGDSKSTHVHFDDIVNLIKKESIHSNKVIREYHPRKRSKHIDAHVKNYQGERYLLFPLHHDFHWTIVMYDAKDNLWRHYNSLRPRIGIHDPHIDQAQEVKTKLISYHLICLRREEITSNVFGNGSVVFQVGVVLDLDSKVGRMGLSHLNMALKDFYSAHENHKTRLVLHVRDSREQVIDAAAVDVEVDAIVGPQKSAQANFVMDLGDRAHVPVISFSATSPSVLSRTQYFVQTALSDDTQVGAIAAIVEAFLWREVVIINEDTDYGNGVIPYLSNALKETARISYRSIIPLSASDDFIEKELYKMMTIQTRVFVVHMSHFLGTRLFLKAKEIGMLSEGYVWIITNGLMDLLSMDSNVIEAMQGVLGVKPHVPQSKRLDFFQNNPNSTIKQDESSIFGLWSDDTMWALAMAAEKVGLETPINNIENISTMNSINLFNFRISQTGPKLLEAMLGTTFEGLSALPYAVRYEFVPFKIVDGSSSLSYNDMVYQVSLKEKVR
ncbi:hypothetical protein TEA_020593 [Camellia sinensis var. sinensis]|uniref:Receptor ligand binding region domain-containing protein n=1 Tax=Camellia sinensis var. sinensis TaxID=542762 RepID=A0A4S4EJX4_CAMSN|nr:hypothetical protein TEA_020593 [Camellia sinensis var. sinensis]